MTGLGWLILYLVILFLVALIWWWWQRRSAAAAESKAKTSAAATSASTTTDQVSSMPTGTPTSTAEAVSAATVEPVVAEQTATGAGGIAAGVAGAAVGVAGAVVLAAGAVAAAASSEDSKAETLAAPAPEAAAPAEATVEAAAASGAGVAGAAVLAAGAVAAATSSEDSEAEMPSAAAAAAVAALPAAETTAAAAGDDLTIIEGIGPKSAEALKAAGMTTFAQLGATDAVEIKRILTAAGVRQADPETWQAQAGLAAAGRTEDLQAFQAKLKGGRRTGQDDFLQIEGIGSKVRDVLAAAGIASFGQLADTEVATLKEILKASRLQMIDPATWPDQAKLARAGRMTELREWQASLKGGRAGSST